MAAPGRVSINLAPVGIEMALDNRHRLLIGECLLDFYSESVDIIGMPAVGLCDGLTRLESPPDIPAVEGDFRPHRYLTVHSRQHQSNRINCLILRLYRLMFDARFPLKIHFPSGVTHLLHQPSPLMARQWVTKPAKSVILTVITRVHMRDLVGCNNSNMTRHPAGQSQSSD
jgi:hypothetical protein